MVPPVARITTLGFFCAKLEMLMNNHSIISIFVEFFKLVFISHQWGLVSYFLFSPSIFCKAWRVLRLRESAFLVTSFFPFGFVVGKLIPGKGKPKSKLSSL